MSEGTKYYNSVLWEENDSLISTNNIKLSSVFSKDEKYGVTPVRLQIAINNYKSFQYNTVSLRHQDIVSYLLMAKPVVSNILNISKNIQENNKIRKQISLKLAKKNLYTDLIYRIEHDGMCCRIALSDRTSDFLDGEKIYINYRSFISFTLILKEFRDSYLQLSSRLQFATYMENVISSINSTKDRLSSFCNDIEDKKLYQMGLASEKKLEDSEPEMKIELNLEPSNKIDDPLPKKEELKDEIDSTISNEIDKFINDNRDSANIGVTSFDIDKLENDKPEERTIIPSDFTESFLKNDVANLEMYIINCINENIPFDKFVTVLSSNIDGCDKKDLVPGCSKIDYNAISYFTTMFAKYHINQHLSKKIDLPSTAAVVSFDAKNINPINLSICYELYMYLIYYSQLSKQLKEKNSNSTLNKTFISFCMKAILSPLVFSMLKHTDKSILISEVTRRYKTYQSIGVFKNIENDIKINTGLTANIHFGIIEKEISRTYDALISNFSQFMIESTFDRYKNGYMKLHYNDFKTNDFTIEQILKIITLEFNYQRNKKIDFKQISSQNGIKDFSDIPDEIIKRYGMEEKRFDNTNLIRYIKEIASGDTNSVSFLSAANSINKNAIDLKNKNIDFSLFPLNVLKALWLWDVEKDKKITMNYNYFVDIINKSSLDRPMLLSLLNNIDEKSNSEFLPAFVAART